MGRDLTKRYASLFETHRLSRPLSFVRDVYATGKCRELSSFVAWELLHRLRLFPVHSYLAFTDHKPLALQAGDSAEWCRSKEKITQLFAGLGLRAESCARNWKYVYLLTDRGIVGCMYPNDNELYGSADGNTIRLLHSFPGPIKAIFVSRLKTLFVCVRGAVYRLAPNAVAFERVLDLASPESFIRHNNGMTEAPDGTLLIGEYGNVWNRKGWTNLAFLYSSSDDGATWTSSDFLIRQGTNKHVHVVKYSKLLNKLLVADGDNYKKLWVSDVIPLDSQGQKWTAVNRFHMQMGGYTSIVESDGKVFFGTDYQGGTNFIVESSNGRTFTRKVVPDPYRRSPVDNMVIRQSGSSTEIWANLPYSTPTSKCLLMFSSDSGQSWRKVLEYNRSTHVVWIVSSSGHVSDELYVAIEDKVNKHRAVYRIGGNQ